MVASLMEALTLTEEPRVITASEPPYEIRHTNKAWHTLTGYKFTEVVHMPNHFLQGPGTEKEELGKLKEGVSQAKHTRVRVLNYTKDGAPFYNTIECHPLRDTSGTLTHFCGVLKGEPVPDLPKLDREPPLPKRDPIQKPPESPSSSRRSKRMKGRTMLADALNNKHDAVVLTEAKEPWRILHVNQPWCEMCGYTLEVRSSPAAPLPQLPPPSPASPRPPSRGSNPPFAQPVPSLLRRSQEVEGLTNSILQGPETDREVVDALMRNVKRGEPGTATLVNYKKGGVRFVNQVSVQPLYNEQDELEQFMAMLHEVDESPAGTAS